MKKIKIILMILLSFTFLYSCNDLEEVNTNPDKSTSATPDRLATNALVKTFKLSNNSNDVFTQITLFSHHVTKLQSSPDPNQYYWSYWPYGGFGNYKYLTDLSDMVSFAEGSVSEPSYRGLALFLKAWYGFNATLQMGDIPYSEAGMAAEGITKPVYDKQADVFQYILDDLEEAESYFAQGFDFSGDMMYDGDASKWQKLCNALQLKVIQTMSKQATSAQIARFAAIVSAGNLMTGYDDDFKLVYSGNANATYPFTGGTNQRTYMAPSTLAVDFLKANNDYRLFYFADPAQAQIDGGALESDFAAYVGAPYELDANTLSLNNDAGMYSLLNFRYTQFADNDPLLYFTYSEQCFIIAEAIEEGWVAGGSAAARTYYENGVKEQLSFYMNFANAAGYEHGMAIDQSYIDNYFTGEAAYKTGGTKQDRLEQILTQRWLVDFFQPNSGSYYQFSRTGYPAFVLNPATSMNEDNVNEFPKRWKYPTNEVTTNPGNYESAISSQYGGADVTNQTPWYLK